MDFKFNKLTAYLAILAIWACIYLPALGTLHIDFNEGRRIMPAVEMLDSGNWKVPSLAGEEYFKKPPMINWLIAGSFIVFGDKSEFAARFPSAIAMLAFVSLLVLMPSGFLDLRARFAAAVIFLTCIGCIDSGRQAEIDSVYACVTGMAIITWLNIWSEKRKSSFGLWFFPSLIIGFGLLLKGPVILLFYYMTVFSVLVSERKTKEAMSIFHFIGIVVMLGIFFSWFLSLPKAVRSGNDSKVAGTWVSEIMMRFRGEELNLGKWPVRVLGAFLNFLPWLIFTPLLFSKRIISGISDKDILLFKGCRIALVACLVLVNLMPGTKARYSLPVYGLASMMTAWVLVSVSLPKSEKIWRNLIVVLSGILTIACILTMFMIFAGGMNFIHGDLGKGLNSALIEMRSTYPTMVFCILSTLLAAAIFIYLLKKGVSGTSGLIAASGVLVAILGISAAVFAFPVMAKFQKGHDILAEEINAVTNGKTLFAYKTECEPFFFYIRPSIKFIIDPGQLDGKAGCLIFRTALQKELEESGRIPTGNLRELYRFKHRRAECVLIELDGG